MTENGGKRRDRAVRERILYFLTPSKLIKSRGPLCALISSFVLWIAVPGGGTTGEGLGIAPVARNKLNVFNAAPVSRISTLRGSLEPGRLKSPPPYVKTGVLIVHRSQDIPSKPVTAPLIVSSCPKYCSGGTTGTAAGMEIAVWPACTRVDVWMWASARDPNTAPTMNDPNASAVLLITSPSDGASNCSEWAYHWK